MTLFFRPPGEQTPLVKIEPAHLRYQTLIGIPYAHVLRDDEIPMESSTVDELSNSAIFFLSNNTISEKGYETGMSQTAIFVSK